MKANEAAIKQMMISKIKATASLRYQTIITFTAFLMFTLLSIVFSFSSGAANILDDIQPKHWSSVPNSHLADVAWPPQNFSKAYAGGTSQIIKAWSGGAYDDKRDRLIIWGGGHNDYPGNEIYVFDVNTLKWERINNATFDVGGDESSGIYPDGNPRSRHTYNYIQYVPVIDKFCSFGGAGLFPSGQISIPRTDCFDFETKQWERKSDTPVFGIGNVSAYDSDNHKIWVVGNGGMASWDPITDTWIKHRSYSIWAPFPEGIGYSTTATYRPRKGSRPGQVIIVGRGGTRVINVDDPSPEMLALPTTGDTAIESMNNVGLDYDPVSDSIIAWNGGTDVYELDSSNRWTKHPAATTNTFNPGPATSNGQYGRWRYVPSKNVFIGVTDTNADVFVYKFSDGSGISPPHPPPSFEDTTPPTPPTNLSAAAVSSSQVNLSWSDSTDNVGVTEYRVYRGGNLVATVTTTSYQDTGLTASTSYTYSISAIDAARNESAKSETLSVITLSPPFPPSGSFSATIEVFNIIDNNLSDQRVFSVVPLPYGQFNSSTNLHTFSLTNDATGETIPAQIEVGRKWWDQPGQPLRDLHVVFLADSIPPMTPVTYTFQNTGTNPEPMHVASASETATHIMVDTGAIRFEVKKKGGEISRAWVKKGNSYELVVDNTSTPSRCMQNRFGNTFCPSRDGKPLETPYIASIEKNGPIEVVLKFESPATVIHNSTNAYFNLFPEEKDPVPGYVRFYRAYAGGTDIEVDDLVLNNPIRPGYGASAGEGDVGWPLFYKTNITEFRTTILNPSVRIGFNPASKYSFTGNQMSAFADSVRATQDSSTNCKIGSQNAGYCTWAQIVDSDRDLAMTISAKFMREENPNAYAFDKTQKSLSFEMAPNINLLYKIEDMGITYDEYTISFHDHIPTEEETHILYKRIRQPVMGRPSLATILKTKTLTEFRTMIPSELVDNTNSVDRDYHFYSNQLETQDEWGLSQRLRQSVPGGIRGTGYANSLTTKIPEINKMLAYHLRDTLLRQQLPPTHWATVGQDNKPNLDTNGNPTNGAPLKLGGYNASGPNVENGQLVTPALLGFQPSFPSGFSSAQISMRPGVHASSELKYTSGKTLPIHRTTVERTVFDMHHHWLLIPEIYILTGDPVAKYFLEAYKHIFLIWAVGIKEGALAHQEIGGSPRALGNMLYSLAQTYSALGDSDLYEAINDAIAAFDLAQERVKTRYPDQNGRTNEPRGSEVGFSFQEGYQISALAILQEMINPSSSTAQKVWRILHGDPSLGRKGMIEGLGKARFPYYKLESDNAPPSGTTATAVPGIVAAAIHTAIYPNPFTAKIEPKDYINLYIIPYLKGESWDGISGTPPYNVNVNAILQNQPVLSTLVHFVDFSNDQIMPLAASFPSIPDHLSIGGPKPHSVEPDTVPPAAPTGLQVN